MTKPRTNRNTATTSKIMSSIKAKGSKAEKALAKAMWEKGLRYRKHLKVIIGKPDFVFIGPKVVVFCDGDFWHGKGWGKRGFSSWEDQFKGLNNEDYWRNKIFRNMQRDDSVNKELDRTGWTIIRFLESDILSNSEQCALIVSKIVGNIKQFQKECHV